MNLKLFVENNRSRSDKVGKLCQSILSDPFFNWRLHTGDQLRQIRLYERKPKYGKETIDQFFNEYKAANGK